MEYAKAFQALNMHPREYMLKRALPIAGGALVVAIAMWFVGGIIFSPLLRVLVPLLVVVFGGVAAAFMPLAAADTRRAEIDNAMPFFMTHFGVLSTSNIPRSQMIKILAEKPEYGALAQELQRMYGLVTDWNMSMPEACRFMSRATPSQIFADFLERLAHATETGQDLAEFLKNEQSVVMKEYTTIYETALYQVENWKDIYVSVVMSGAFFTLFAVITPVLTGASPQGLLIGVFGFLMFMEVLLLMILRVRVPPDRLHHDLDIVAPERRQVRKVFFICLGSSAVILVGLWLIPVVPVAVAVSLGIAPLGGAGWYARQIEERIKRREDNFGAFIRSLGASAGARGGSLREVLKQLQDHNFGPLSGIVNGLYARLTWRLDDTAAWKHFSAESGSNMVNSFTDMFTEGIKTGGKPDDIGDIINHNVVRIMNLRKGRYSTAGTFRGVLIGLTGAMAFVMFAGVGILGVLGSMFMGTAGAAGEQSELVPVQLSFDADLDLIGNIVLVLLAAHGLMAGVMLKIVDGGGIIAGLDAFVIMVWMCAGLMYVTNWLLPNVLTATTG